MSDTDALRQRIINDWSAAASGWRRWEPHIVAFSWPMTLRLVDALALSSGDRVLDVGCGIGDPAIAIAQKVGPAGRVTAIDPAQEMADTAAARAESLGLANMTSRSPQSRNSTLRHSLSTPPAADGRLSSAPTSSTSFAASTVGSGPAVALPCPPGPPQKGSPGFAAVNAALNRQVQLPPLDSTKPCMLQLSDPGQLEAALAAARFRDIHVEPVPLATVVRDGREYWEMTYEMGSSLRTVYDSLTPAQREAVAAEVIAAVEPFRRDKVLRIPALAQIGWAKA